MRGRWYGRAVKKDPDADGEVSREERAKWVKRYRESGLGLKDFAAEHGLKAGRLHYWVYAAEPAPVAEAMAPVFREVRLAGSATATSVPWAAEVVLPSGIMLRLREGTEPGWAGALVGSVGSSCSR